MQFARAPHCLRRVVGVQQTAAVYWEPVANQNVSRGRLLSLPISYLLESIIMSKF